MRFARFPEWMESVPMTKVEFRLAVVLYRHASRKDYCAWPCVETLKKSLNVSRRTIGRLKMSLARKGALCFTKEGGRASKHKMWMAVGRAYDFKVDTSKAEFSEYRKFAKGKPTTRNRVRKPRPASPSFGAALAHLNYGQIRHEFAHLEIEHRGAALAHQRGAALAHQEPGLMIKMEAKQMGFFVGKRAEHTSFNKPNELAPRKRVACGPDSLTTANETGKEEVGLGGAVGLTLSEFEPCPPPRSAPPPSQSQAVAESSMLDKKKAPKKKRVPIEERTDSVSRLVVRHKQNHSKFLGTGYTISHGRDEALAKMLLEDNPLDLLFEANALFFQEKDPFIMKKAGHGFNIFKTRAVALAYRAKRSGSRSAYKVSEIAVGTRLEASELAGETVWDEWDGKGWVQKRVKRVDAPKPAPKVSEGEFDE